MRAPVDSVLLRIIIGEDDRSKDDRHENCRHENYRHDDRPLYAAIVAKALEHQIAGATVFLCLEGFGRSRHLRAAIPLDADRRLPVLVEIIDSEAKIDQFLPVVNTMVESGLVTLERVNAIHYRRRTERMPLAKQEPPTAA